MMRPSKNVFIVVVVSENFLKLSHRRVQFSFSSCKLLLPFPWALHYNSHQHYSQASSQFFLHTNIFEHNKLLHFSLCTLEARLRHDICNVGWGQKYLHVVPYCSKKVMQIKAVHGWLCLKDHTVFFAMRWCVRDYAFPPSAKQVIAVPSVRSHVLNDLTLGTSQIMLSLQLRHAEKKGSAVCVHWCVCMCVSVQVGVSHAYICSLA